MREEFIKEKEIVDFLILRRALSYVINQIECLTFALMVDPRTDSQQSVKELILG